jgi:hypothetical protein
VRKAILDIGDDGKFDEGDVAEFLNAFTVYEQSRAGVNPGSELQDHDRYDLNGDGYTGAKFVKDQGGQLVEETMPFDLDVNGAAIDRLDVEVNGAQVQIDERRVTDRQILCYYAYSPLFEGNETSRDLLLSAKKCSCDPLDLKDGEECEEPPPPAYPESWPQGYEGEYCGYRSDLWGYSVPLGICSDSPFGFPNPYFGVFTEADFIAHINENPDWTSPQYEAWVTDLEFGIEGRWLDRGVTMYYTVEGRHDVDGSRLSGTVIEEFLPGYSREWNFNVSKIGPDCSNPDCAR